MSAVPVIPEHVWHQLARRMDTLLANHGMLRDSLKAGHPPLGALNPSGRWEPTPMEIGVAHYGAGPLLGLWVTCRDVEAVRVSWTGKPLAVEVVAQPVAPIPPVEEPKDVLEPDEAVGAAEPAPPDNQPRLGGV